MIDWQVQVDGHYPPDWDQHRDGCWFPDFAHQEYMLPYFDVGLTSIDPYDGTEFQTADLEKLRDSLERSTDAFTKPPKSLPIPEHLGYGSTMFSPDPKIMMPIVKKTLAMIQYAMEKNGTLVFRGD